MPTIRIRDFEDLVDDFTDTLVLGNGASMVLAGCFSYKSLLKHARDEELITEDVQSVFDYFDTVDFELVMRMLRHAYHVNRALSITDDRTARAYHDLRSALISSVRETHAEHASILSHIPAMYTFMARYDVVLSLNYDLTVYWAMLRGNEQFGGNWFKDCWVHGDFDGDWERFKEPIRVGGSTLVFYPHGNLALATSLTGGEAKLAVDQAYSQLLETIIRQWEEGDRLPLFVSEGETQQKEAAISRSGYLSTVYNDVMTELGASVTIYGWSMGRNDRHILRRICSPQVKRIAVSVYRAGKSDRHLQPRCLAILARIHHFNANARVSFYDSESAGCWLRTEPDEP